MTGEVHTSSQKSVEKISFFSFPPPPPPPRPHHGLSAVSARSEWIRCGCSRAHKSYKHWGNVFQTCLPGVICQEWVTLLHTELAPLLLQWLTTAVRVWCSAWHRCIRAVIKTRQRRQYHNNTTCHCSLFCVIVPWIIMNNLMFHRFTHGYKCPNLSITIFIYFELSSLSGRKYI